MLKKRILTQSRDPDMTLPDERYRAVIMAQQLMRDLCDPRVTARVPSTIRSRARSVLRHYPSEWDMQQCARSSPDVFAERMEDLHKFVLRGLDNNTERS